MRSYNRRGTGDTEERRFLASVEGEPVAEQPQPTFLFMPYFWFLARK